MFDIIYYNPIEKDLFISLAKKLGYHGLVFLHSLKHFTPVASPDLKIINAIACSASEVVAARKLSPLVFVQSSAALKDNTDRYCIERVKPDVLFGFEHSSRKDFLHHRHSSLNQVLCKLMSEKQVAYGLSLHALLSSPAFAVAAGRMMQNIVLCKKYKVPLVVGSFAEHPLEMRSVNDVVSFLRFVGLDSVAAKKALLVAGEIAERNVFKKSGKYIADGVRVL